MDIFKDDKLNRKDTIINLTSLIQNTQESLVLAIDSPWGTGKTYFVNLWRAYLKEQNIRSIYFSAWEEDYSQEPLISILGELQNYCKDEGLGETLLEKTIEKSVRILGRGALALAKGLFKKYVVDNTDEILGEFVEQEAEKLIKGYSEDKKLTEQFKEALSEMLQKLDGEKPFVIFIDELDRCRPLYAIELLERIKHLFGIEGLVFVLSIDKKELSKSIKTQYGEIDTNNYLKRFIQLEYRLSDMSNYLLGVSLYEKTILEGVFKDENESFMQTPPRIFSAFARQKAQIHYFTQGFNLSLRAVEQSFKQIELILKINKDYFLEQLYRIDILIFMIFVKNYDYDSYKNITDITKNKQINDMFSPILYDFKDHQDKGIAKGALDLYALIVKYKIVEHINRTIQHESWFKDTRWGFLDSIFKYGENIRWEDKLEIFIQNFFSIMPKIDFLEDFK